MTKSKFSTISIPGATIKDVLHYINPVQDGAFSAHGQRQQKSPHPLFKICHTYPAMMKPDTVIPYLKKIQKIYESRDTILEFC